LGRVQGLALGFGDIADHANQRIASIYGDAAGALHGLSPPGESAAWGAAPCVGRISDPTRSRRRCAGDARLGGKGVALEHGAYYFCVIAVYRGGQGFNV
jgi:hypothetical protein